MDDDMYNRPPAALPAPDYPHRRRGHGPAGTYDLQVVDDQLRVRIDVPGVDDFQGVGNDDPNVVFRPDGNVFNFQLWSTLAVKFHSPRRVYQGFIRFSRPVTLAEIDVKISNGVLHIRVNNVSGSLHFLRDPKPPSNVSMAYSGYGTDCEHSCHPEIRYDPYPGEFSRMDHVVDLYPQRILYDTQFAFVFVDGDMSGPTHTVNAFYDVPGYNPVSDTHQLEVFTDRTRVVSRLHTSEGRIYSLVIFPTCGCCRFLSASASFTNGMVYLCIPYRQLHV